MTTSEGPLTQPLPWNLVAGAYSEEVVPNFEPFAADAVRIAGVVAGDRVLDVATGPGTLAFVAARSGARVTAIDFSEEMIGRLRARAARESVDIDARVGDGMALAVDDQSFDAAFSMFGLMFFPDRTRGYSELLRALRPGGLAVVASWQSFERVQVITEIFGALALELPWAPFGKGGLPPLSDGDELVREMRDAGFREVVLHGCTHSTASPSLREFWSYVGRTMAPLVLLQVKLGADDWRRLDAAVYERVKVRLGEGAVTAAFTANVVVGRR